jgi:hypothetical protein
LLITHSFVEFWAKAASIRQEKLALAGLQAPQRGMGAALSEKTAPNCEAWTSSVLAHGQLDHHANRLTNWCVDRCMWKKRGALGPVSTSYLAEQASVELTNEKLNIFGLSPHTDQQKEKCSRLFLGCQLALSARQSRDWLGLLRLRR